MIIDDFIKAANYYISEGSPFQWRSFGPNARYLDATNPVNTHFTCNAVFDVKTKKVYEVEAFMGDTACRWIDPEYVDSYFAEAKERGIDPTLAWDNIYFGEVTSADLILKIVSDLFVADPQTTVKESTGCSGKCGGGCGCKSKEPAATLTEYNVKIEVTHEFDVTADSMENAIAAAKQFAEHMVPGDNPSAPGLCWMDRYVSKETISRNLRTEQISE